MDIEGVFGTLGSLIASLMYISMIEVARKNRQQGARIWIQPAVTIINCVVWSVYAYMRSDLFIALANGPGIVVASYTIYTAFRFSKPATRDGQTSG